MPVFKPEEWIVPKTLEEACDILSRRSAMPIAGGTGIYELAKRGMLPRTEAMIDLQGLNLEYVTADAGILRIGAMSRFAWLLKQAVFERPGLLGLVEAMKNVKPVQVRNVATAGGAVSICLPFLDFGPATVAFDASVLLTGPARKQRVLSVEEFFLDYLLPDVKKGEILTEIRLPLLEGTGSAFMKQGRTESDFALVNVCARLSFDKGGKCTEARISMGGVANTPWRPKKAEGTLKGQRVNKVVVAKAVESISDLDPTPTIHGSPWYKRELAKVLMRDALYRAAERAGYPVLS